MKLFKSLGFWLFMLIALLLNSCTTSNPSEESARPLVYEGMSAEDLKSVLGNPERRDTSGLVYDAESDTRKRMERWYYDKRTVILINDTVKSSNFRER